MFRKLTTLFLFILLEVSKAAPQATGEDSPQVLSTEAPHAPDTASNAITTINSFIERIKNRGRTHDGEDAGNQFGSYYMDFSKF